jgi:heme exporter protein B
VLRKIWIIAAKDIAAELHTREVVGAMLVYAVLAVLSFSFALDLSGPVARAAAPGVMWVTVLLAGMLGLGRSLGREKQSGSIDGLRLAPVDPAVVLAGKALGNLLFTLVVAVAMLVLVSLLFGVPLLRADVLLVVALGLMGYACVGTLMAGMVVNTRAQEVMLPVLLLPLVVPVLLASVQAMAQLLEGATLAEAGGWVRLLVVYDLVIAAVSLVTFEYVIEE